MSKPTATAKETSKYTADEKKQLITAAWIAGAAVSECDLVGGARAAARESETLRNAVSRCVTVFQTRTSENLTGEPGLVDHDKAAEQVEKACQDAVAIVEKKDSANVDNYRRLVLDVALSVAAAYGSGFLGTGQKVSDAERQMVDKIAQALKGGHLVEEVKQAVEDAKKKAK